MLLPFASNIALLGAFATSITLTTALLPKSATVLSYNVRGCNVPVTAKFSGDNGALEISYDTTKDTQTSTNSLAWIDAAGKYSENTCIVCTTIQWSDGLYGFLGNIEYDYYHRLEPGSLEQVDSRLGVEGHSEEGYYQTSYIYGGDDNSTSIPTHVHSSQPTSGADPLLLDLRPGQPSLGLCVRTIFRIVARGSYVGPSGELSKQSVFKQTVNIDWRDNKNGYCHRDRLGVPICTGETGAQACCTETPV